MSETRLDRVDELSDSARAAIQEQINRLADGYSGRITLHCSQGGVSELQVSQSYRPKDLARRNGRGGSRTR